MSHLNLQGGGRVLSGDNFVGKILVFKFGAEIFPTKFFCAIWGFLLLGLCSGWVGGSSLRVLLFFSFYL